MQPYQKILELVEAEQLDITTVSLATITGEFVSYVESVKDQIQPRLLADFVAAAAKLMLIKSKALIPSLTLTSEEDEEIKDFELRLKLYKEFRTASRHLKKFWVTQPRLFSRPYLASRSPVFQPPVKLQLKHLLKTIELLTAAVQKMITPTETIKTKIISLEEKMRDLLRRFQTKLKQSFSQLAINHPRQEIIATFLAILHLVKEGRLTTKQQKAFAEIEIQKI